METNKKIIATRTLQIIETEYEDGIFETVLKHGDFSNMEIIGILKFFAEKKIADMYHSGRSKPNDDSKITDKPTE